ncbi:MAG: M20 family metallopeptidase [Chloroflexi bacterium]|nr:MAG: M20 family metallopeptidase [Chloroflexota bacterium]TMG71574.1 MAG: M20 family metallopeptidase [Chloroflexota bacterium]
MSAMDRFREDLVRLSREINADPELAYEEHRAVARIAALLEKHGHRVEKGLAGLPTAFRARVGPPGPTVALLAEYDALPDVGHGCGHNLISMTIVGAFLAAAADAQDLEVGIELIGTPAEEKGGGKIDLLDKGVFRETVAALFSHPGSGGNWSVSERLLGITVKRVIYEGLAAHAAVSPEKGRNALTALIALFVSVDGWRQHLPSTARVHGIVREGGVASNIIPSRAVGDFGIRAADMDALGGMVDMFTDMAKGAALQTGTKVAIEDEMRPYLPVKANPMLGAALAKELERLGKRPKIGDLVTASGDIGNVSQKIPTDYIGFPVSDERIPGHSHKMREASVSDYAHESAFVVIQALAATALKVATDRSFRESLRS